MSEKISWLDDSRSALRDLQKKNTSENQNQGKKERSRKREHIAKQVDDLIVIRGLKGKTQLGEIDLSDEEINEVSLQAVGDKADFVSKLSKLVQLTGYTDPIYAEAFVNIHKFDILFEVLLINRTPKPL